jgi:hypothetical protein
VLNLKKDKLSVELCNLTGLFDFKSSLFLKDVPYVTYGTPSLIFNLNNNFIIKNND